MSRRRDTRAWRQKVHPLFAALAEGYKEHVEAFNRAGGEKASAEQIQNIREQANRRIEQIEKQFPTIPVQSGVVYDLVFSPGRLLPDAKLLTDQERADGHLARIHWEHYREPWQQTRQRAAAGDAKACDQILRSAKLLHAWMFGYPARDSKIHKDHTTIMEMGFGLGLDELTEEELADCYDDICPCGSSHDAASLKQLRRRVRKEVRNAAIRSFS